MGTVTAADFADRTDAGTEASDAAKQLVTFRGEVPKLDPSVIDSSTVRAGTITLRWLDADGKAKDAKLPEAFTTALNASGAFSLFVIDAKRLADGEGRGWRLSAELALDFLAEKETLQFLVPLSATNRKGTPVNFGTMTLELDGTNDAVAFVSDAPKVSASAPGVVDGRVTAAGSLAWSDSDLADSPRLDFDLLDVSVPAGIDGNTIRDAARLGFAASLGARDGKTGAIDWSFAIPDSVMKGIGAGEAARLVYEVTIRDERTTATRLITIDLPGAAATTKNLVLTGSDAAEWLRGEDGDDDLKGQDGDDTLEGGSGADRLAGGKGADRYTLDDERDVIVEEEDGGDDSVESSVTFGLPDHVENLTLIGKALDGKGNGLANRLSGNAVENQLSGGAGGDSLDGAEGADTLDGGDDDDLLDGGAGADWLAGGRGADRYVVDENGDVVVEEEDGGDDTVDSAIAFALPDHVEHLRLVEKASEGKGNGRGNRLSGNAVDNRLSGDAGADSLDGAEGSDTLDGGDDDDHLDGGAGADWLLGGRGSDRYVVDDAGDVVVEDADGGDDTVESAVVFALPDHVEHLTLVDKAAEGRGNALANRISGNAIGNHLSGGAGRDSLDGAEGSDTLHGGDDDDLIDGGAGRDSLAGGKGDDTYRVDHAQDTIVERAGEGVDLVESSVSWRLADELENLVLLDAGGSPSRKGLSGTGNAKANRLSGNADANSLQGLAGDDVLDGGAGNDTLAGGIGDDLYRVDAGDVVVERKNQGIDTVETTSDWTLGADVEVLRLLGDAALRGVGNALGNHITGNGAANTLIGHGGNDTLDGGAGADRLEGGTGNDVFRVDHAGDVVVENAGEGLDLVIAAIDWVLGDGVERLELAGDARIDGAGNALDNHILGNALANRLEGGLGRDTLAGGAGDDVLVGGAGSDLLTGGAGLDAFRFLSASDAGDRIADFVAADDVIEISASGFGGGLLAGMDLDGVLIASRSGRANAAQAQFIWESTAATPWFDPEGAVQGGRFGSVSLTGKLWFDVDGTGHAARVLVATITGTGLSIDDLVVIA